MEKRGKESCHSSYITTTKIKNTNTNDNIGDQERTFLQRQKFGVIVFSKQ